MASAPKDILVVTGGVISGLGKGVTMAAIGRILAEKGGRRPIPIKLDPYLNVDAGKLSPYEHGEVFVLEDGGEVDLDFGTYQRELGVTSSYAHSITGGKVTRLLEEKAEMEMLGKTIQERHRIEVCAEMVEEALEKTEWGDLGLVEVGGTVGEDESSTFLWAVEGLLAEGRATRKRSVLHVHIVYIAKHLGEYKTKPAQQSRKLLAGVGLHHPDVVICRSEDPTPLPASVLGKVQAAYRGSLVLDLPLLRDKSDIPAHLSKPAFLSLLRATHFISAEVSCSPEEWPARPPSLAGGGSEERPLSIHVVGKYASHHDAYHSVFAALKHTAAALGLSVHVTGHSVVDYLKQHWLLERRGDGPDAVVIPGGFGERGVEETITLCDHLLFFNKTPTLAICMGMQCAGIAAIRRHGYPKACSYEHYTGESDATVVVHGVFPRHGMLLGGRDIEMGEGYTGSPRERFRNRFGFTDTKHLEKTSFQVTAKHTIPGTLHCIEQTIVAAIRMRDHPFFVGTQYHPEFASRPDCPSPDFAALLKAAQMK